MEPEVDMSLRLHMSRGIAVLTVFSLIGLLIFLCADVHAYERIGGGVSAFAPVAAAILLHEVGHMMAARLCGVRMSALHIDLFGARLRLAGTVSYRHEAAIAAAGPLCNLLSAAILLAVTRMDISTCLGGDGMLGTFVLASLGLAAVNLLPVRSLDGGRVLYCFLAPLLGERAAEAVLVLGTALCLGGLWVFSVYALLRAGEMLTLFAFSVCLLCRMMGR